MKIIPLYLNGGRIVNAVSALKNLTDQGKHPCCDAERIMNLLPERDEYAVQPQVEIGKVEVAG